MNGQVAELRILGIYGRDHLKASGWFDDVEALADAATHYDSKQCEGIYVTINPVHHACLARSNNQVREKPSKATADQDILARHWLPIDIDPVRPSGVSSDDTELGVARARTKDIIKWLEEVIGFPPGIRAHSGNGLHLLYRIQFPSDDASTALVRACLQTIKDRFSDDKVKIDNLFNPSRIWKLYGTVARKGQQIPGREHRRSCLWKTKGKYLAFDEFQVTDPSLLDRVAALAPVQTAKSSKGGGRRRASVKPRPPKDGEFYFDLDTWLTDNNIPVAKTEPWGDSGVKHILQHCLFDPSHTRTSACIGRSGDGKLFYKCFHDSCTERTWKDVRSFYEKAGTARRKQEQQPKELEIPDNPWELARQILDDQFIDPDTGSVLARRHREQFYVYTHDIKAYRPWSNDTLCVLVTRWLGDRVEKVTTRKVYDVVNCLGAMVTMPADLEIPFLSRIELETMMTQGDPERRNWITLTNGILDVNKAADGKPADECLLAHNADWLSTASLPFPFPTSEDQAACDAWAAFLEEVFQEDEDRVALLQEAFGYCLFQDNSLEAFFVLHGPGRNGKSTVLDVLSRLLGEQNVTSMTPDQLSNRYMVYSLHGKLANVCADLSEMDRVEEGLIKAIVSGDLVAADRKYKDSVQFRPRAKLFFATNVLPRFTDTSLGVWRRMKLIPFNYIVPIDKMDIHLFNKLERELPGILLWALDGMVRLKTAGRFSRPERCERATRQYRNACFPVLMFIEECTMHEGSIIANELWKAYRRWCEACGLKKPKPLHTFVQDVVRLCPHVQYQKPAQGMERHVELYGLKLRDFLSFEDGQVTQSAPTGAENCWDGR